MPTRDYFAELYVAGKLADAGWNVYFPKRDQGFDFIIERNILTVEIIRPVQVKGKYPTEAKNDSPVYGFVGELSRVHLEMVLAIPFFDSVKGSNPRCIAYMPATELIPGSRGYRCQPAKIKNGLAIPRRDYKGFFDEAGIEALVELEWSKRMRTPAQKTAPLLGE